MNENETLHNDEIDLKELFSVLWKGKFKIISMALGLAIIVCLITMFIIKPVFDTRLDVLINVPEKIESKYGNYTMLLTSNDQYIELIKNNDILTKSIKDMGYGTEDISVESLSNKISITKDEKKKNSFVIKISANEKGESLKLAQTIYDNYISYIKQSTKTRAAEQFMSYYEMQREKNAKNLETTKKLLDKNVALLSTISQTINSKEAIKSIDTNTLDYVVLENAINENYTKVEADIIAEKQLINVIETNIDLYNGYIEELKEIEQQLVSGNEDISFCDTINTSIKLSSNPVEPSHKSSPRTGLNTVIGGILGGMIGVMYVLIRKYWFDK